MLAPSAGVVPQSRRAQQEAVRDANSNRSDPQDTDDNLNVTTEEVFVPVLARDTEDRLDRSTLGLDEILVLEDGVRQQVTSVRRTDASVLFVLDTTGVENRAMRTTTTSAVARKLVASLPSGTSLAVLEQGARLTQVQDWTIDRESVDRVLHRRLGSGNAARNARHTDALIEAARIFETGAPVARGNRHVVLITDGVERFDGKTENIDAEKYRDARRRLAASGALLHVLSYTRLAPERSLFAEDDAPPPTIGVPRLSNGIPDTVANAGDTTRPVAGDPRRGGSADPRMSGGTTIVFDPAMRRRREAYDDALARSEARLAALAAELGGKLWLPGSADDMRGNGEQIAREIAAQYIVAYKPRHRFASGERRRLEVVSRRAGLRIEARRLHVTGASKPD